MSSTTTPTDFSDLYTDVLNRVRANSSDTTSINIAKRLVNQGLHDLHIQKNWPWAERRAYLQTHARYTTGTIDIALATRTTVTGSSTTWNTAVTGMGFNNARAGGKMKISDDVYTVSAVGSDTSITLAERWLGDTALDDSSYTYYEDEYALASDFFRLLDARQFSDVWNIPVIPRMEFYRRYPRNASSFDAPQVCTIIDLAPSGSTSTQPRVLFHPAPDDEYNIPYRYITTNLAVSSAGAAQVNLSADADEPIIPLRYRHVLVLYAIAHWYRDRKDDTRSAEASAEYVDLVKRMAGDTSTESDLPLITRRRPHRLRYSRSGRFTTGTRWDHLRE